MTITAEFSFKEMGLWGQISLIPFAFQFQIGPLSFGIIPDSAAARFALWTAVALQFAVETENEELMERIADVYNGRTRSAEDAEKQFRFIFPHLSDRQVSERLFGFNPYAKEQREE